MSTRRILLAASAAVALAVAAEAQADLTFESEHALQTLHRSELPTAKFEKLWAALPLAAIFPAQAGEPTPAEPAPLEFKLSADAWKAQCPQIAQFGDLWVKGAVPERVKYVPPRYPTDMLDRNLSGSVTLGLRIDTAGTIVDMQLRRATDQGFVRTAADAVWRWSYQPTRVNGKPACVEADIDIGFSLE